MAKLKIAVLIDWYLPGTKAGGPVRSVFSLVQLLKEYYDFYIVTTNTDLGSSAPYEGITADRWFEKDGVSYYYFSQKTPMSNELLKVLQEAAPDVIYINSFWSYGFSISALRLKKSGKIAIPLVLAPRGMLGKGAMGLKSFKKQIFLLLAKTSGLYRSVTFHATNEQEAADIRRRFLGAKIVVVPNINSGTASPNVSEKYPKELVLFYLSRISKVKNLHFALSVLSRLPSTVNVSYDIYGNIEDEGYWAQCRQLIDKMPAHVKVRYCGELPFQKVQDMAREYNGLFLPTLNENFGHSIVESLLCGCIVVISDQTPWNDVNLAGGYALPLGDEQLFADALVECASLSAEEFAGRSAAAVAYITKKTDLASASGKYKKMFDGTIKN